MATADRIPRTAASGRKRVLAYCHDGMGVGHLRRTLNICEHVGAHHADASFLVLTGSPYVGLFEWPAHVDFVKLPALRKLDNHTYESKFLSMSSSEVMSYRAALLLETARQVDPDVLLVDKAPVGVCAELLPTLRWLRTHRPATRLVFGMRDIEDEPAVTRREWSRLGAFDALGSIYDEIWVYGSPHVFDVAEAYGLPASVSCKLRYLGYLTRGSCPHPNMNGNGTADILVTVGGGTDGDRLVEAYLADAAGQSAALGFRSVIVAGPDLPRDRAGALRARCAGARRSRWIDFSPCMLCRIRQSHAVVCMGGYNTLCEVVVAGRPALVVPRNVPRLEQTMRARLWSRLGVVQMMEPDGVSPETLGLQVRRLLTSGHPPAAGVLALTGLQGVLERFNEFFGADVKHAAPVPM